MVEGAPWFHLRDILRATDHRPFFIRNGLLPLEGLHKFLQDPEKPRAPGLLKLVNVPLSDDSKQARIKLQLYLSQVLL